MADRIKKYLKNLDKETTQAGNAGETLRVLKGTPKGKAAANKLRNERGQMFGALLQGRRYDENGKQITKSSSKPVAKKTTAKPTVKPVSPKTKQKNIGGLAKNPVTPTRGQNKSKVTPKSKLLTGEAAAKELQKRTSPKGVKEFEKGAKKALEKKYPGLYKKSN